MIFICPLLLHPNNDGKNDQIFPSAGQQFYIKGFSIFTRWGQKDIYHYSTRHWLEWNINGLPQNGGIYIWVLNVLTR